MKKMTVIKTLSDFSNGGNAFLLLSYLLELKQEEIKITQSQIAKDLNKTRPAIQKGLELLEEQGFIKIGYNKIQIVRGSYE